MNRRKFLKRIAQTAPLAGSALVFPRWMTSQLNAAENTARPVDHLFVQIQIEGGADVLQSIDPMFIPKNVGNDKLWRGYTDSDIDNKGEIFVAPAAKALLRHAADILPVRGIWMDPYDKSHESCRTYMASGLDRGWKKSPILVSEMGRTTEKGLGGVLVNTTREFSTGGPIVPNTLLSELRKMTLSPGDFRYILAWLESIPGATGFFGARESYAKSFDAMKKLSDALQKIQPNVNLPIDDEIVMALAFSHGISTTAFLNLGGDYNGPGPGLDTHSGHSAHLKSQMWFWDRIAWFFDLFKKTEYLSTGDSLFSRTTFLVTNEFSRPPMLNGSQGKDHNCSTNAALLAGRGVAGGRSIGGSTLLVQTSSSYHALVGLPYDFDAAESLTEEETRKLGQQFSPLVRFIRPEDLILTVAAILGIEKADYQPLKGSSARVIESAINL